MTSALGAITYDDLYSAVDDIFDGLSDSIPSPSYFYKTANSNGNAGSWTTYNATSYTQFAGKTAMRAAFNTLVDNIMTSLGTSRTDVVSAVGFAVFFQNLYNFCTANIVVGPFRGYLFNNATVTTFNNFTDTITTTDMAAMSSTITTYFNNGSTPIKTNYAVSVSSTSSSSSSCSSSSCSSSSCSSSCSSSSCSSSCSSSSSSSSCSSSSFFIAFMSLR